MSIFNKFDEIINSVHDVVKSRKEWNNAVSWANKYHPNWVHLATQRNRPEINRTYRNKILRGYCDACL